MQRLSEGSPLFRTPTGQSTSCAKWKRNAAFTWYSAGADWVAADCGSPETSSAIDSASSRAEMQVRPEGISKAELVGPRWINNLPLKRTTGPALGPHAQSAGI